MRKLPQLTLKISLLFLVALITSMALFFHILESQKSDLKNSFIRDAAIAARIMHAKFDDDDDEYRRGVFIEELKFVETDIKKELLNESAKLFYEERIKHEKLEGYKLKDELYLVISNAHRGMVLKYVKEAQKDSVLFMFFGFVVFFVSLLFILTIKSLSKIRALLDSREIFNKALMHELKTPIAKGRVSAEMLEEIKYKDKIIESFERINGLIDEFSVVERLSSKNYEPNIKEYVLDDLLDAALDRLMLESGEMVSGVGCDAKIEADFEMFVLALKNLIDNAIKYSSDGKVEVVCENGKITIKNSGKFLEYPIKRYFEPFFSHKGNQKSSQAGLGLGLFIAKKALELQNKKLVYKYQEPIHSFTIGGK